MSRTRGGSFSVGRPGADGAPSATLPTATTWLVVVATLVLLSVVLLSSAAIAADPDPTFAPAPTTAPFVLSGDPRSDGQGPGIIGSPLAILVGVVVLGLAVAAVTYLLVRLTQRD